MKLSQWQRTQNQYIMLVNSFANMLENITKGVSWTDQVSLINGYMAYLAQERTGLGVPTLSYKLSGVHRTKSYSIWAIFERIDLRLFRKVMQGSVPSSWWYWCDGQGPLLYIWLMAIGLDDADHTKFSLFCTSSEIIIRETRLFSKVYMALVQRLETANNFDEADSGH